jgi:competence protein ComEA
VDKHIKKLPIFGVITLCIVLAIYIFHSKQETASQLEMEEFRELINQEASLEKTEEKKEASGTVFVDIKGAVKNQGVYQLNAGTRVKDAISLAGGFTEQADLTKVNLAALLHDEMVIYVPTIGEQVDIPEWTAQNDKQLMKININTASIEELQSLSGIGQKRAEAIVQYREENGPFKHIEDLLDVSGIGEKLLEKIRDHIIVN